ncbi:MAG: ATP-binding protein [Leptonema sp. (in: bacteria)]
MLGCCIIEKRLILFANFFIFFIYKNLYGYPIDLTELPAYVRVGFHRDDCQLKKENIDQKIYKIIEPNQGNRKIHIVDLEFSNLPKRKFFEFRRLEKKDFTILFYIELNENDFGKMVSPAFLFAEIGESWKVYLNNHLIDDNLSDTISYNQKDVIIHFPISFLKVGTNVLCLQIRGDPLSRETGLYYGKPYLLGELTNIIYESNTYYLLIFLVTVYSSIGFLSLIFYIKDQNKKYHLYFSLFSLFLALYIFMRSSLSQKILNVDANLIFRSELFSLFLLVPLFGKYIENIVSEQRKLIYYITNIGIFHSSIFVFGSVILPVNSLYDLILLWQLTTPFLLLSFVFLIFSLYYEESIKIRKTSNIFFSLLNSLLYSIPGNLLIGVLFIAILSIYDIYINLSKKQSPGLSNYGFLVFLTGASLRVFINLLDVLKNIEDLNKKLKKNIQELKIAYSQLQISEKKYKHLFNQTSDILMIINEKGVLTNLNSSFEKVLGLSKEEYINKPLQEIIYFDANLKHINEGIIQKIQEFLEFGDSMQIQIPLKFKDDIPFKYFNLFFEKVNEPEKEYLIRATLLKRNPSLHYLDKSYVKFIINNEFNYIDNIISYLTEDLNEFFSEMDISMIRIGLREILINAIEHGNLEINHEEKTRLLHQGIYSEVLKERLTNPLYNHRKVTIEYKFTKSEVIYKITDQGKGFDATKYMNQKDVHLSGSLHGRGIFITKNAFDKVMYNKKGNCAVLIKYLKNNETN